MYQQTDRYLKRLKSRIRTEFNHLSLLSFDELNVVFCRKKTQAMYDRLEQFNLEEYKKIAESGIEYAKENLPEEYREKAVKVKPADIVKGVLSAYNLVTGYLYNREADRKRMRLNEEMLTAEQYKDRQHYRNALNKSANLWFTQSEQYAIDVEDSATKTTWKKAGVKKLQWHTQEDGKVCAECQALDGQIFDINDYPGKQHYRCRCYAVPYVERKS